MVDMLTYGFFGASVREAMMLGKPVVCYLRPEWLEQMRAEIPDYVDELPVVSATPETVRDVLARPDRASRASGGRSGGAAASSRVKWHSAEAAATPLRRDLPRPARRPPRHGRLPLTDVEGTTRVARAAARRRSRRGCSSGSTTASWCCSTRPTSPCTSATTLAWFDAIRERDDVAIFGIRLTEDDSLIGSCQLARRGFGPPRARACRSASASRTSAGAATGRRRWACCFEHAFGDLGLRRVQLHVFANDAAAIRCYEKVGFVREGVLRESALHRRGAGRRRGDGNPPRARSAGGAGEPRRRDPPAELPALARLLRQARSRRRLRAARRRTVPEEGRHLDEPGEAAGVGRAGVGDRARRPRPITACATIAEMRIDEPTPVARQSCSGRSTQSYGRAPGFDESMPIVERVLEQPTDRARGLQRDRHPDARRPLGLDEAKLVRSSSLGVGSSGTERLIELTRAVGGDAYLSGDGAAATRRTRSSLRRASSSARQDFRAPRATRSPSGVHVPGLSVVDALMSWGSADTSASRRPALPGTAGRSLPRKVRHHCSSESSDQISSRRFSRPPRWSSTRSRTTLAVEVLVDGRVAVHQRAPHVVDALAAEPARVGRREALLLAPR